LVYLHDRLVHTVTRKTPFKAYFGAKPDLLCLKLFDSWVCVKRSGSCRSKLDCHDLKGIFLGYTATDQNIVYLDLSSGVVKSSHHAKFDEVWYLQPSQPPAAQLLYNLGFLPEEDTVSNIASAESGTGSEAGYTILGTVSPIKIPWPLMAPVANGCKTWSAPNWS
jgi:hypothetical protein